MTKHLRRRPGHMTAEQLLAIRLRLPANILRIFTKFISRPGCRQTRPKSMNIMTIISVGTNRPTTPLPDAGSTDQFPASSIHARIISSAQIPDLPRSCRRLIVTAAVGHSQQYP